MINHEEKLQNLDNIGSCYTTKYSGRNYYFNKIGKFPYVSSIYGLDGDKVEKFIENSGFTKIFESRNSGIMWDGLYNIPNTNVIIETISDGGSRMHGVNIYHDENYEKPDELSKKLEKLYRKVKANRVNMILSSKGEFSLRSVELPKIKMSLSLNYGSSFLEKNKCIQDSLKSDKAGIILLHSTPGMGKSSYIHHLCNVAKKNFIFLPVNMADSITSPSFMSFLMDKCLNSVLIIEDAENVLKSRELAQNSSISDLLNITDGLLGKAFNIKIIATYNTNRASIDEALMRKGRLLCEHEFKKLSIEESKTLFNSLYPEEDSSVITEPQTLADIYNINIENFRVNNKRVPVGFKN